MEQIEIGNWKKEVDFFFNVAYYFIPVLLDMIASGHMWLSNTCTVASAGGTELFILVHLNLNSCRWLVVQL